MLVEAIEALHERLRDYIEATYHIADPQLLRQRRRLLDSFTVLRQPAFIESTRVYAKGAPFARLLSRLAETERTAISDVVARLASREPPLLHDPPYEHQLAAAEALLADKHVVVFTGTGSGKTECFTIPILFRLLREAISDRASFSVPAVRAIVLYPMNALVNDQLSRIRLLLGDEEVSGAFARAAGRPARFGQYTGRTPFPGLRDFSAERDGARMTAFKAFYMDTVLKPALAGDAEAHLLLQALRARGRWPSKPKLNEWFGGSEYGASTRLWEDRLHTQPEDRELIARHEFYGYRVPGRSRRLGAPPDVLITNYSMLEYMLMRPVERHIFETTHAWLDAHRDQTLFLVLDEAHLYRGAQGTEVALLVRRLFERLGLSAAERRGQVRVAVTSASFSSPPQAAAFAAQLVGARERDFQPIGGRLEITQGGAVGTGAQARSFANVDLDAFYDARTPARRLEVLEPLLRDLRIDTRAIDVSRPLALERAAYSALEGLPLRRELVTRTQIEAFTIGDLATQLFPEASDETGRTRATEVLVALCAFARTREGGSNLLPSRIHSFHRGLPGLWICLNPRCDGLSEAERGGIAGALYPQPRDACGHCGARVLELFSCRSCGAAYARGYCSGVPAPTFVWSQGTNVTGLGGDQVAPLLPVDLLLEVGRAQLSLAEIVDMEVNTGALLRWDAREHPRVRRVGLYRLDDSRGEDPDKNGRPFFRCGVCRDDNDTEGPPTAGRTKVVRRSPVEDHQTAGQEPFYALVHEQLMRQPARAEKPEFLARETPLRGRKVLIFSDGRQKAARLAAELGRAALRDSARPILLRGFQVLQRAGHPRPLNGAYAALLLGAIDADIELRATDERFDLDMARHLQLARNLRDSDYDRELLGELEHQPPPAPIATILLQVIRDKHTGLQALALGRIVPFGVHVNRQVQELLARLSLGGLDQPRKRALVELWLGLFLERQGCDLYDPEQLESQAWWLAGRPASGLFRSFEPVLQAVDARNGINGFKGDWLPELRNLFCEGDGNQGTLRAARVTIQLSDRVGDLAGWVRCARCSRVQGALAAVAVCVHCGVTDQLQPLDVEPTRGQFIARKGFYRKPVTALPDPEPLLSQPLVVREHSAQLTGHSGDIHNRAERYELAFQDITAKTVDGMRSVVDVLSCTTTMEVGIDIGSLSGVALRNMPPGRANYQQRAGRAGRRGSGVATVLAYADQDGHNQHFYENPQKLVKDPVPDPTLNLSNRWITRRHINAFLLQRYLAAQIPATEEPTRTDANLFASLGTVEDFVGAAGRITMSRLRTWLARPEERQALAEALGRWLPQEVDGRDELIARFDEQLLTSLSNALREERAAGERAAVEVGAEVGGLEEVAVEDTEVSHGEMLLERLLYEGILPKYAFPTDLVAFSVFEATNGLGEGPAARDKLRYAPQRNLSIALSEYAPGKTVFIDGRAWAPGALYSPIPDSLEIAFKRIRYIRSCEVCEHTQLFDDRGGGLGTPCPSCGEAAFGDGEALAWLKPPGFAHPVTWRPRTEPDLTETARAGRAVLAAPSPPPNDWIQAEGAAGILTHLGRADDRELIVTNHGPREQGFRVCRACGMIEPAVESKLSGRDGHYRPDPGPRANAQPCGQPQFEIVRLGTSFRTDVLVVRFLLPPGQDLDPRHPVFRMTLTSLTEALAAATCVTLEIESGEVLGGYRRGFTPQGPEPRALEVFLYDQLAGGAGYVVEARRRIGEILDTCCAILSHGAYGRRPASPPCDRACYGCLLSFKNSHEHAFFDRLLALDLVRAAQTGQPASLPRVRQTAAYSVINDWLAIMTRVPILRDAPIAAEDGAPHAPLAMRRGDGHLVVPALAHPFSPSTPVEPDLAEVLANGAGLNIEVVPLDFLEVTRSLPTAMERLRDRIDG
jgi:ATP-dependent helicase YprA (DUF1998 family)